MIKRIPKIGEQIPFFDDGKYSPSRLYTAVVVGTYSIEEAKAKFYIRRDGARMNLYEIWRDEIDSCRNASGVSWLYAEDTDCFVVCAIPEYDDCLIVFARTVSGRWFSLDIQSDWQAGALDVDLEMFERYKEDYPDIYNEFIKRYKNESKIQEVIC